MSPLSDHHARPQHGPELPEIDPRELVWHYTDGHGLVSILSGHTLWATSSAFLNDRQEIQLGGELVAQRIRELAEGDTSGLLAKIADKVATSAEHGEGPGTADFYILSASQEHDSLAMWRLYGGAAESYAIGLDPSAPLAVLGDADTPTRREDGLYLHHEPWQPVRYAEEEQIALVDGVVQALPGTLQRLGDVARDETFDPQQPPTPELGQEVAQLLDDLQELLFLIKHPGFVDERETRYRVVLVTGGPERRTVPEIEAKLLSYRPTTYGIAPFVRLTGGDPDSSAQVTPDPSPLPIRAVAISPSPNGDESTGSLRRLLVRHGYDVPVLRSAIPFRG